MLISDWDGLQDSYFQGINLLNLVSLLFQFKYYTLLYITDTVHCADSMMYIIGI